MTHPSDVAILRDELRAILEKLTDLGAEGIEVIEREVQAAKESDIQVAS